MKKLTFAGVDGWDRPVYKDDAGRLWKDVNLGSGEPSFYRASDDDFDGEPDYPMNDEYMMATPDSKEDSGMITRISTRIKVEGHCGTWYVIYEGYFVLTPDTKRAPESYYEHCFLLEHEKYGDEVPCLIVSESGTLIADDIYNGFEDLEEAGWSRVSAEEYAKGAKK